MDSKASSKTLVIALAGLIVMGLQQAGVVAGVEWSAYEGIIGFLLMFALRLITKEPVSISDFLSQLGGLIKKPAE